MSGLAEGLVRGDDGVARCWWGASPPDYAAYHDQEWGWPVTDDRRLFEKVCLEGFQAGLSWLTILRKRDHFRRAFADFDFRVLASWGDDAVARLLGDAGIVRHRGKIESTLNNARRARELAEERGSLAAFFWEFVPPAAERPAIIDKAAMRTLAASPTSKRLAKELKRRGWRFVGPTTAYAFMQAMGLVNDHLVGCACRGPIEAAQAACLAR
jgi:DNA-3-methyladenine glycosylase I